MIHLQLNFCCSYSYEKLMASYTAWSP